jgi:3-hydroxybutyryl-CoA dehydrogenase
MARSIDTVGVVGLGTMGAGIAEVFARTGLAVIGVERDADALELGRGHVDRSTGRAVRRGRISEDDRTALIGRIMFTTEFAALAPADLVIEAVPELLDLKRDIVVRLDGIIAGDAVLATNTSSLSVTEIAAASGRPERVVGMHFFNPAPVLKLIEVIRTGQTDDAVVNAVVELARRLGKVPVVCGDQAGFIANALLIGYLNQAAAMVGEGYASAEVIDGAVRSELGFPMGPLALLDLIGLDTTVEILRRMHGETGRDRHVPAPLLVSMAGDGRLGRKSGRGFYEDGADALPATAELLPGSPRAAEVAEALLRPYLDDAVRMRDTGYATEADIDTAMTLGCGLPRGPFEMLAARETERTGTPER